MVFINLLCKRYYKLNYIKFILIFLFKNFLKLYSFFKNMKITRLYKIKKLFYLILSGILITLYKKNAYALYYMQIKNQLNYSKFFIHHMHDGLKYSISAQYIHVISHNEHVFFSQPKIIIFDEYQVPIWIIESIQAYLSKDHLHLSGSVKIKNFFYHSHIKQVLTENFKINLKTQDFISKKKTSLYGIYFYSIGNSMQGNLKKKFIRLNTINTIFHEK
ncbi:MAG: LPS export ABC transporter periplasmic protein LptC [Wigglesworthia glossinidia]|nr:LPS export ABC transporter periplasmic protein LptC [Wigglesworthia glossinidia]